MPKRNLLIVRLNHPERCAKYAHSDRVYRDFNIHVLEHKQCGDYARYSNRFSSLNMYPSIGNVCRPDRTEANRQKIKKYCYDLLEHRNIDLVVNSQPLHPYNTWMQEACEDLGVETINTEMGLDNKMLFDRIGSQYTANNEIEKYVNTIEKSSQIQFPATTRQPQPDTISPATLYHKYGLCQYSDYVVILGQLFWDMSVKQSMNPAYRSYVDYWKMILDNNQDQIFIVKPHPLSFKQGELNQDLQFLLSYPNVKIVNESLQSLFQAFKYFTAFSSTTIIEGLLQNKKFATMGYHFCNNDDIVLQLKSNNDCQNLLNKLKYYQSSASIISQYMRFIFNYYMIDLASDQLYDRLVMDSEEYFNKPRI